MGVRGRGRGRGRGRRRGGGRSGGELRGRRLHAITLWILEGMLEGGCWLVGWLVLLPVLFQLFAAFHQREEEGEMLVEVQVGDL